MLTKLDLVVALSINEEEVMFKKVFQDEKIDNTLKPYQCFSNKQIIKIGEKHYSVDYSFIVKELEG